MPPIDARFWADEPPDSAAPARAPVSKAGPAVVAERTSRQKIGIEKGLVAEPGGRGPIGPLFREGCVGRRLPRAQAASTSDARDTGKARALNARNPRRLMGSLTEVVRKSIRAHGSGR